MVNEELRKELQSRTDEELLFFDNLSFDNSIIGLTHDNRVAYLYSKMVLEARKELECSELEAIEWIDYNTIRALSYLSNENKPVIIFDDFNDYLQGEEE